MVGEILPLVLLKLNNWITGLKSAMNNQSYYQQLGVSEDASFEEIQEARERLKHQYSEDRKLLESIEMAYDAILMERLRLRQEGKIKVPEAVRLAEATPAPAPAPAPKPQWLERLLDTPSKPDILWPAGVYGFFSIICLYPGTNPGVLQILLALGLGSCLYFLNRKERLLGRSVLLTMAALIIGFIIGGILTPLGTSIGLIPEKLIATVTFFIFWLTSSFLR